MTVRNLDKLLSPHSVAVFGASQRPGSLGAAVWRNLARGGFDGQLWPVNPRHAQVGGTAAFAGVHQLPAAPDLAVFCTPPNTIAPLLGELGEMGTRAALICTPGLSPGQRRAVLHAAGAHGLRLLGPGSVGAINPHARLDASLAPGATLPGELAFVSQSAALTHTMLDWASSHRIGFSSVVSLGEQVDVDFGDMLDYLAGDTRTRAILLYIESIGSPRKFISAARAAARSKPVIVVKAGRSSQGARASATHVAASGDADLVFDAAIRRAGMLRVDTLQELFVAAQALARLRTGCWETLTVAGNGGGAQVLAADAAARHGVTLAELGPQLMGQLDGCLPPEWSRTNPVDIAGDAPASTYAQGVAALLADPSAGAILFVHSPTALVPSEDIAQAVLPLLHDARGRVLTCWLGGGGAARVREMTEDAGLATFRTPEDAVRAFAMLQSFRRNQRVLMQTPDAGPSSGAGKAQALHLIRAAQNEGHEWLPNGPARAVLAAYGIASAAAEDTSAGHSRGLHAREVFVGARVDPVFGPVVLCGHGGLASEALPARAFALPPLNRTLAGELVERAGLLHLLGARPGRPAAQVRALHDVLVAVSLMLAELPMLAELDIDPLYVHDSGAVAGGVRLRLAAGEPCGIDRFAIVPYPAHWVRALEWRGRPVTLRPIRPEDEPRHARFLAQADPQDMRMRFFCARHVPDHTEMARLTQIDYDREMAFVVEGLDAQGRPETLGVGRTVCDPDCIEAEFALMVRSDLKHMGLGRLLLDELIRHARSRGIERLVGFVLPENEPMLALARRAGFADETCAAIDGEVRRVVLRLHAPL